MPSLLSKFTCLPNRIFLILLLITLSSCSSRLEDANRNFLKQYSKEVETINTRRDQANIAQQADPNCPPLGCETNNPNKWKDSATIFGINNSNQLKDASIDTSKIVMPKPPEEFLPDVQTLMQGSNGQKLPDNMFEVSYNLFNFPQSYGRPRVSFDDIDIPKNDAFGVRTELGEKNYQLIGNRTLQRDIDFSKQLSGEDDKEISLELIKQEKRARKKGKSKINNKDNVSEPANYNEEIKTNSDKIKKVESQANKPEEKPDNKSIDNIVGKVTDQIKTIVDETTTKISN